MKYRWAVLHSRHCKMNREKHKQQRFQPFILVDAAHFSWWSILETTNGAPDIQFSLLNWICKQPKLLDSMMCLYLPRCVWDYRNQRYLQRKWLKIFVFFCVVAKWLYNTHRQRERERERCQQQWHQQSGLTEDLVHYDNLKKRDFLFWYTLL